MILIGGHRGSGCTDSEHAAPYGSLKYAENTLPAIRNAIDDGAGYIEVDAIQTRDDQIAITHSNNLSLHVFGDKNPGFVSEYTLKDLKNLRTGPRQDGEIPSLEEVLSVCKDVILNIEIKDVKGTADKKLKPGRPLLLDVLAETLKGYKGRVIVSSFSLQDIQKAAELMPEVKRGMLFNTHEEAELPVYNGGEDGSTYLHFTAANLHMVGEAAAIHFAHPCLGSTPPDVLEQCKELGLGVNAWSVNELPPQKNPAPVRQCVDVCQKLDIPLTIMTDFVPEMRHFLESQHQKS